MSPPVYKRLDRDNCLFLFIDHQAGLIACARDFGADEFRNNVLGLVRLASYFKVPSILTTSFDTGVNGPIAKEITEQLPDAPLIRRPGEINAMDNPDFAALIKKSGKKQIVISGVLTEVCVAFPALTLIEQGYDVWVVTDASGTFAEHTREAAQKRMAQAGVQLLNWAAVGAELQRDWRRDIEGFGKIWEDHVPVYRCLLQSYNAVREQK
ncbi:Isochorismatase-like protein [Parachaetomium inaequale]|uniref:Isochorismatase-like protein n=1 Tax=Parachaetomium inaequale TaxID=2588326 RepID=A0AAN6PBX2_9PEZI|nr:Isochorismatase-like protein [Parachaetomium inaequale]